LYHELGHPLLAHENHPVLDKLRTGNSRGVAPLGVQNDATKISGRWQEALDLTTDSLVPDYMHCYPDD
jgi:hypothetical protein